MNGSLKAAVITIIGAFIVAWVCWVSFTVLTHCEISAANKVEIENLKGVKVVVFEKIDVIEKRIDDLEE